MILYILLINLGLYTEIPTINDTIEKLRCLDSYKFEIDPIMNENGSLTWGIITPSGEYIDICMVDIKTGKVIEVYGNYYSIFFHNAGNDCFYLFSVTNILNYHRIFVIASIGNEGKHFIKEFNKMKIIGICSTPKSETTRNAQPFKNIYMYDWEDHIIVDYSSFSERFKQNFEFIVFEKKSLLPMGKNMTENTTNRMLFEYNNTHVVIKKVIYQKGQLAIRLNKPRFYFVWSYRYIIADMIQWEHLEFEAERIEILYGRLVYIQLVEQKSGLPFFIHDQITQNESTWIHPFFIRELNKKSNVFGIEFFNSSFSHGLKLHTYIYYDRVYIQQISEVDVGSETYKLHLTVIADILTMQTLIKATTILNDNLIETTLPYKERSQDKEISKFVSSEKKLENTKNVDVSVSILSSKTIKKILNISQPILIRSTQTETKHSHTQTEEETTFMDKLRLPILCLGGFIIILTLIIILIVIKRRITRSKEIELKKYINKLNYNAY